MAANYLHGVETVVIQVGGRSITVIKTAVVGLVGIAPNGPKQTLTILNSPKDAAQFGAMVPGFNIPEALEAIFAQGPATVLVVNVFDENADVLTVNAEIKTVVDGKIKLSYAPTGPLVLTDDDASESYEKDVDFKLDAFGNIQIIGNAITEGQAVKASYERLNPATITPAKIIGALDPETNVRTGAKLFDLAMSEYGFKPKILIAPGYSDIPAVASDLLVMANKYRAVALLDAPAGKKPAEMLSSRGPGKFFEYADKRAELLYPRIKMYSPALDADILVPYSAFFAGAICATDFNEGYHVSPSNRILQGQTGVELPLTAEINDPSCDVNQLNAVGITTVFRAYGTGVRTWGNRNASYPLDASITSFLPVLRTSDIIAESIEYSMLPYADKPINFAIIDTIKEDVNSFLRAQKGRGAIIDGECKFNNEDNPPAQVAAGQIVWEYTLCPPPPLERMTFKQLIDINLLKSLG